MVGGQGRQRHVEVPVGARVGVEARLRKDDQVHRLGDPAGEAEMVLDDVAVPDLLRGGVAVEVVALHHGHPQPAGGREVGHRGRRCPGGGQARRRGRPAAGPPTVATSASQFGPRSGLGSGARPERRRAANRSPPRPPTTRARRRPRRPRPGRHPSRGRRSRRRPTESRRTGPDPGRPRPAPTPPPPPARWPRPAGRANPPAPRPAPTTTTGTARTAPRPRHRSSGTTPPAPRRRRYRPPRRTAPRRGARRRARPTAAGRAPPAPAARRRRAGRRPPATGLRGTPRRAALVGPSS